MDDVRGFNRWTTSADFSNWKMEIASRKRVAFKPGRRGLGLGETILKTMKKIIFAPEPLIFIIGLAGLMALGSCRKSDKIAEAGRREFVGDWKLSDLMLVNSGDKPPRKLEELPRLNDLRFAALVDRARVSSSP